MRMNVRVSLLMALVVFCWVCCFHSAIPFPLPSCSWFFRCYLSFWILLEQVGCFTCLMSYIVFLFNSFISLLLFDNCLFTCLSISFWKAYVLLAAVHFLLFVLINSPLVFVNTSDHTTLSLPASGHCLWKSCLNLLNHVVANPRRVFLSKKELVKAVPLQGDNDLWEYNFLPPFLYLPKGCQINRAFFLVFLLKSHISKAEYAGHIPIASLWLS